MIIGDYVVYGIAGCVMAFLAYLVLKRWICVGIAVIALGVVIAAVTVAPIAWQALQDHEMMKSCLTAHERRAKAAAAPDDYFGRQLRQNAAAEAGKCAEFAAKQEAAKK